MFKKLVLYFCFTGAILSVAGQSSQKAEKEEKAAQEDEQNPQKEKAVVSQEKQLKTNASDKVGKTEKIEVSKIVYDLSKGDFKQRKKAESDISKLSESQLQELKKILKNSKEPELFLLYQKKFEDKKPVIKAKVKLPPGTKTIDVLIVDSDTLESLAKDFMTTVDLILLANLEIKGNQDLKAGKILHIPHEL